MTTAPRQLERGAVTAPDPVEDLVVRAKRYEPEALAEAFEQNFERIFSFLYAGLGDDAQAEEMTARVFSQSLAALPALPVRTGGMTVFLYRIAASVLGDHLRRLAKQAQRAGEGAGLDHDETLRAGMGTLSEGQARVLMLRFFAGMDSQEISDVTGLSLGRVQSIQHRGLERLYRYFQRRGIMGG